MKNKHETINPMKKILCTCLIVSFIQSLAFGQQKKNDTVIVELAKTSRLVFSIKDRSDLPTLRSYDYQALFNDILAKIEASDTILTEPVTPITNESKEDWSISYPEKEEEDTSETEIEGIKKSKRYSNRYKQGFFNFDIGMNNYLSDGKFPDQDNKEYAVRPWGSWYVGVNSIQKIRIAGKFFAELGVGVSWYNFKFQDNGIVMSRGANEVAFSQAPADINPQKSKLTVCYLNASLIPVLDFGKHPNKSRFWGNNDSFRIGLGPYVGYRIDSYSKRVFEDQGDKERDRDRNNYYLNNIRYGARFQVGFKGTDLFVNYDMNELFAANRGPKLNAFSFGVIF